MSNHYPDGLGSGPELLTNDIVVNGGASPPVFYLSADGDDGNPGTRALPWLTLAFAEASLTGNACVIVLMDGFTETLTGVFTAWSNLTLIGEGGTAGDPSCELTMNHASEPIISIETDNVLIENIKFKESAQANSGPKVVILTTATRVCLRDCYFESGENDTGQDASVYIELSATREVRFVGCYFVSTTTTVGASPGLLSGADFGVIELEGCVIDAGTMGFKEAGGYGAKLNNAGFVRVKNLSMLRGGSFEALSEGAQGYVGVSTSTGDSLVSF